MDTVKSTAKSTAKPTRSKQSLWTTIGRDIRRNKLLYLMVLPVIAYYVIFDYGPMYGLQIAFKDYSPGDGIWGSRWIGLANFTEFFQRFLETDPQYLADQRV